MRRRIVQDVIHIVIASDRDGDNTISRREAKTLSLKIRLQLESYGVEFDSEKFLNIVGSNPTIAGVISIVQKLLPNANDEDREANDDDDSDDYDMFYIVEADDHASISVTSEDIIGAAMAFGGDTPSVGKKGHRQSLIADPKKMGMTKRVSILSGSLAPRR